MLSRKDYANSVTWKAPTSLSGTEEPLAVSGSRMVASELVRLDVDVIVAPNTPAARALRQVTTSVPIVVPVMGDPVGDGLVASLGHLGGNITELTFLGPELLPQTFGPAQRSAPDSFPPPPMARLR